MGSRGIEKFEKHWYRWFMLYYLLSVQLYGPDPHFNIQLSFIIWYQLLSFRILPFHVKHKISHIEKFAHLIWNYLCVRRSLKMCPNISQQLQLTIPCFSTTEIAYYNGHFYMNRRRDFKIQASMKRVNGSYQLPRENWWVKWGIDSLGQLRKQNSLPILRYYPGIFCSKGEKTTRNQLNPLSGVLIEYEKQEFMIIFEWLNLLNKTLRRFSFT